MSSAGEGELFDDGAVVGRWQLGPASTFEGGSSLHSARSLGSDGSRERLVEVHLTSTADEASQTAASLAAAAMVYEPELLTIVDSGVLPADAAPGVYAVTERWDEIVGRTARPEADVLELARNVVSALAAIHRAGGHHGAVHRAAIRRVGSTWKLASAGLGDVLTTELAAYRPPGLHVMEQPGPAADMWNLGVVLHELATGRLLRPGEQPSLPDAPTLERVVHALLQPEPGDRPTAEAVQGLAEHGWSGPAPQPAPTAAPAAGNPTRQVSTPHPAKPPPKPVSAPGLTGSGGAIAGGHAPESGAHDGMASNESARPSVTAAAGTAGGTAAGSGASGSGRGGLLLPVLVGVAALLAVVGLAFALTRGSPDDTAIDTAESTTVASDGTEEADGDDGVAADAAGAEGQDTVGDRTSGTVAVADLQTGDCIDIVLGRGLINEAALQPCDAAHNAEVIDVFEPVSEAAADEFPGRLNLQGQAGNGCLPAFQAWTGTEMFVSQLDVVPLTPTFTQWSDGSLRTIICLAVAPSGQELTESVQGRGSVYALYEGSTTSLSKIVGQFCFDTEDGLLELAGKRQTVTTVGCANPHRFTVFDFGAIPGDEFDLDQPSISASEMAQIQAAAAEQCLVSWEELTLPDGLPEPAVFAVTPDPFDWLLGDRIFSCVARWEEPVLGNVGHLDRLAERGEQQAEGDLTGDG